MRRKEITPFQVRLKLFIFCLPGLRPVKTAVKPASRDDRQTLGCQEEAAEEAYGFILRQVLERDAGFFDG